MSSPSFVHLRIHSTYSLLEGAVYYKELASWCKKEKMPAVAVADHGNLFGALEFATTMSGAGVQPIHACTIFLEPEEDQPGSNKNKNPEPEQLLLIAQNEQGWRNLLKLVSLSYLAPPSDITPRLSYAQLAEHTEGLMALTAGIYGGVGHALVNGNESHASQVLNKLEKLFPGRLYIELMRHGMPDEKRIESTLIELAMSHDLPLVATNDVYFTDEEMFEAHDAFICIGEGSYVGEAERRRLTPNHYLKTPEEMCELFADVPEALANTVAIAQRCSYMTHADAPMLPGFTDEQGNTDEVEILKAQAREGLDKRLEQYVFTEDMDDTQRDEIAKPYLERLEYELEVIISMRFPGYFLIVSDFIKWAKEHEIPVGPGRGSGAGSLVAWSLLITDLDPLRYGLLFERFLNPERVSMPDFDIDFCQDRRDEVIHYVQQRYGKDKVAQIITFGKLQARAVLRDAGRVLQMPYGRVDKICKLVPNNPANPVTLKQAIDMEPMLKEAMREPEVEKLIDIALKLEGLKRHASTHAAGVVIGDRPLDEIVALYRDPKSEMPVVQYSMKFAEKAGLVKFDFLGLKTLSVIKRAVELIKQGGVELDIDTIPLDDAKAYELLGSGQAVGVFQLESAGMRDTLKKLKPDSIEDIIALVSLYRPGPMDNIPTYIARKHGKEKPNYLHEKIESILKETFGVIIYQEQVMQIAQVLASYSLGEADLLRRAMGKKIKAEMDAQRDIFVEKAVANGVEKSDAKGIFDLIAKFAEYGFNKSHAAAYALIAYQTAYLKANHTVEFLAASMHYDMHNTDKLAMFVEEAASFGIDMLPPDVNKSEVSFAVEEGNIRYALAAVRNVGAQAMQEMVEERRANGNYADMFDLVSRVPVSALNKRGMEYLVKSGSFDALHNHRAQLAEGLERLVNYGTIIQEEKASNQVSLFAGSDADTATQNRPPLPEMDAWPILEQLSYEFEAIGFYLTSHPLTAYEARLDTLGIKSVVDIAEKLDDQFTGVTLCGIVTGRKFKVSNRGRFAFVQMSDRGGVFEVSIFDEQLLDGQRDLLEPGSLVYADAQGKQGDNGPRFIIKKLQLLDEYLRDQKPKNIRLKIVVNDDKALPNVSDILGSPSNAGYPVLLEVAMTEGEHAQIKLPGKYQVGPHVMDQLTKTTGVASAEEVA